MGPAGPEEGEGGDAASGDGESETNGSVTSDSFYGNVFCCQEQLERQQNDGKLNSDKHMDRKRELNLRFLARISCRCMRLCSFKTFI